MMKSQLRFICLMSASLLMMGCSMIDKYEFMGEGASEAQSESFDVTAVPEEEDFIVRADISYDDLALIANQNSGGAVQLYSLDGQDTGADKPKEWPRFGTDYDSYMANDSVEVYPLAPKLPRFDASSPVPIVAEVDNILSYRNIANNFGEDGVQIIRFPYGKSDLNAQDKRALSKITVVNQPVSVEGHASQRSNIEDPIKRQVANLKVSMNRAFNVAKTLIEDGVPAHMIETKAYGEARPIIGVDSEANQRVEIKH